MAIKNKEKNLLKEMHQQKLNEKISR